MASAAFIVRGAVFSVVFSALGGCGAARTAGFGPARFRATVAAARADAAAARAAFFAVAPDFFAAATAFAFLRA